MTTTDWPYVALRWTSYGDLGLLFGVPAITFILLPRAARERLRGLCAILALLSGAGLLLAVAGFVLLSAAMAGVAPDAIDASLLKTLALQTAMGWAFIARCIALTVALTLCLVAPQRLALPLLPVPAAIAVASLAWSGHGNATGGSVGALHLAGDIVHLLAASAWLGAIALLLALVAGKRAGPAMAQRALAGFAPIGSLVVVLLLLTGIANLLFLVAPSDLLALAGRPYGRLLIIKIGLFLVMLGLAAANRFCLTPALGRARTEDEQVRAARRLSRSLRLELALAVAILALVAWFGRLEP